MTDVRFIGLADARQLLADRGIVLNDRQMRRATEPDAAGRRRLPFFRCPLTSRLICREDELLAAIGAWGADPPQIPPQETPQDRFLTARPAGNKGSGGRLASPHPPQTRHNEIRAPLGNGGFPRV